MEDITIQNLSFTYPEAPSPALRELSLTLPAGSFTLLCGPSGCGKTTLLRLLKPKLSPHGTKSGTVVMDSRPLEELSEREQAAGIGFVMQNPESQIVTDKVWHELAFGLENLGLPSSAIKRRVGEMAGFFGIDDWFRADTSSLSGGQKQLLNLAAVMVMQPRLLLLDEPTSQLDPIAASEFVRMLQKINRELGVTILLTEHRLEEVFPVADQVAVLEHGSLLFSDTPGEAARRIQAACPTIACGLPAAARIFAETDGGTLPLTVREARRTLAERFPAPTVTRLPFPREPSGADTALELRDVWFRYHKDGPDVLRGAHLQVKKGEILALLGGNGAGKSTALSVLSGLARPYRGKTLVNGRDVKSYKDKQLYHRLLASLPQNPQTLFIADTLAREFDEAGRLMGHEQSTFLAKRDALCNQFGLERLLERHPYDLSGGEQQKAALVKILLLEPRILLLDEPTKGIDPAGRGELRQILKGLRRRGLTVLLVTHDVEFAAETADRCGLLFDGEVVGLDAPENFFSENHFYTTAASRISRDIFKQAVTCRAVSELCRANSAEGAL